MEDVEENDWTEGRSKRFNIRDETIKSNHLNI